MNVNIPKNFFLKEAKSEYYSVRSRLVAELIQNSFDAGATEIQLEFSDDGYSCIDNGSGMDWDTLRNGMLTLGGSVKSAGSTGGFGAAKKLLIFAHDSYSIHTKNLLVIGEQLSFELDKNASFFQGTKIECLYLEEGKEIFDSSMDYEARSFLRKCNFEGRCKVFINGSEFREWLPVGDGREEKFGLIYLDKSKNSESRISVLHNGLFMFDYNIWNAETPHLIVNVSKPSREVFSQSRDCFTGEAKDWFEGVKSDLIQNPLSSVRKDPIRKVIRGFRNSYKVLFETIERVSSTSSEALELINYIKAFKDQFTSVNDAVASLSAVEGGKFSNIIEEVNAEMAVDFYMDIDPECINGKDVDRFHPKTGLKKYRSALNLYRILIEEIAKIKNCPISFSIGAIVDSNGTLGQYRAENGNNIFYINPMVVDGLTPKNKFFKILSIAVHEFTHFFSGQMNHNERFTSSLTEMFYEVTSGIGGYVELNKRASLSTEEL